MRMNFLNQPLGIGDMSGGYAPRKKHAISLAIPIAMAGASVLSSIFGGSASAKAARKAQAKLDTQKTQTEAERLRAKHQTWLDTASGQNILRMLRDEGQKYLQGVQGAAKVGGATEAAVAAQKELNNQKQAEVIAEAQAAHEDKKDAVDASYRQQINNLTQQQIGLDRERAGAIAGAASGVSSALAQGAIATFGGTKVGQEIMGAGSPGGGASTPEPASTPVQPDPMPTQPAQLQQMGSAPKIDIPQIGDNMSSRLYQMGNNFSTLRNKSMALTDDYRKFFGL